MSGRSTIWHRPRGRYVLPPDEVHVWRASLDQPQDLFARLTHLLSAEERAHDQLTVQWLVALREGLVS